MAEDPAMCPADLMPLWMAHLTPWIDDRGTNDPWPSVVRKYASLASRWHVLNDEQWEAARRAVVRAILRPVHRVFPQLHNSVSELLDSAFTSELLDSAITDPLAPPLKSVVYSRTVDIAARDRVAESAVRELARFSLKSAFGATPMVHAVAVTRLIGGHKVNHRDLIYDEMIEDILNILEDRIALAEGA